jgi:glycosyltransferase
MLKVSIITTTFNSQNTILDTMKSVSKQTYQNIEHVIIDGNSTDNTLSIINQNKINNAIIVSEPDNGIYSAFNKGLHNATGDIVGFLNSDDFFSYNEAIQDVVSCLSNNRCDSIYADLQYVQKNTIRKVVRNWKSGTYNRKKLKYGWMPPHPTFYMKKKNYTQLGGFDETLKVSADYDAMLRYLWLEKISCCYLPKCVVTMRLGGHSNKNIKNILIKMNDDIKSLKKNNIPWPFALIIKNITKIPQFF